MIKLRDSINVEGRGTVLIAEVTGEKLTVGQIIAYEGYFHEIRFIEQRLGLNGADKLMGLGIKYLPMNEFLKNNNIPVILES